MFVNAACRPAVSRVLEYTLEGSSLFIIQGKGESKGTCRRISGSIYLDPHWCWNWFHSWTWISSLLS